MQGRQSRRTRGFGEKTQTKLLEGIAHRRLYAQRTRIDDALAAAEPVLDSLRQHPDVIRCSTAGSLRRWRETIGDVDFLVSSKQTANIIEYFVAQPGILSVSAKGDTKASVILEGGIQADLRVVTDEEFPFALAYFTGSKEHNIVMRQRAIERGLRLNEYGLFKSKEETRDAKLRVPPGTQSGQRFRMRERGAPSAHGRRGDLIIEVRLVLPKLLDERSKELLREFGRINAGDVRKELAERR